MSSDQNRIEGKDGAHAAFEAGAATASIGAIKRKNRGNLRKRSAVDSDDGGGEAADAGGGTGTTRKAQNRRDAPLAFTTKREDKVELFKFESSGTVKVHDDGGATRANEIETAADRDNRAVKERALQRAQDAAAGSNGGAEGDIVYRGMTGYRDYRAGFRRENTVGAQKAAGSHGPLRASANVRTSILVDYQPDVCKDYKETGYCGYGDACKFLHDRGDYKAGWELDREWNQKQKELKEKALAKWNPDGEGGDSEEEEDGEDDELPFACFICRRPWEECQDPVVTKCKHYFCEQCALQHNAKSGRCFTCEQPTGGIFNVALDILKREKERKKKKAGGA